MPRDAAYWLTEIPRLWAAYRALDEESDRLREEDRFDFALEKRADDAREAHAAACAQAAPALAVALTESRGEVEAQREKVRSISNLYANERGEAEELRALLNRADGWLVLLGTALRVRGEHGSADTVADLRRDIAAAACAPPEGGPDAP